MSDKAEGYVTEIPYSSGYFEGLGPPHMELALLGAGLKAPDVATACELGCGNGLSLAIHASSSVSTWYANDINPAHIATAQRMVAAGGADVRLSSESFAEFADRKDLPQFDFIGLHGVWSWISDSNRAVIAGFLSRHLRRGGVVYLSYNVTPGWSAMSPVRELMVEHALRANPARPIGDRIDSAIRFTDTLLRMSAYGPANPGIVDFIAHEMRDDRRGLAHDYFNRDWQPMPFSEMSRLLASTGLHYACSARYLDDVSSMALTPRQWAELSEIADPVLRQMAFDVVVNRRFRCDYWVRDVAALDDSEKEAAIGRLRVVRSAVDTSLPWKIRAALTINGGEPAVATVDALLAAVADGATVCLSDVQAAHGRAGISPQSYLSSLLVLGGLGLARLAREPSVVASTAEQCTSLNRYLTREAATTGDFGYLASAVTGGGIKVDRLDQLFIGACLEGRGRPEEWAMFADAALTTRGRGQHPYAIDHIREQAAAFTQSLPLLRSLHLI